MYNITVVFRLWPEYVKERIHSTYAYFGGSVVLSAASAAAVFRTPTLINLASRGGWLPMLATFALMIGSGMVARSIPYEPGLGAKQLAWAAHCTIMGGVLAPLCFVGGPIIMRAAWYTAGIVGGLSTVAVCAPSDKFLYMGGPLAIGLGVVFASSMAGIFLPPTTVLGAGIYSISLYGGLLLFSGFLLYDTQRIVRKAEAHPLYATTQFDPVNSLVPNIFIIKTFNFKFIILELFQFTWIPLIYLYELFQYWPAVVAIDVNRLII